MFCSKHHEAMVESTHQHLQIMISNHDYLDSNFELKFTPPLHSSILSRFVLFFIDMLLFKVH